MSSLDQDFDRRPDPQVLLALAEQERRGKLRVFLGAAPGVGKTYAMLSRARALKADGEDVVIGLVETHGRLETEALTEGQEILPRRKSEYRGRTIEEFDIDAALARARATSAVSPSTPWTVRARRASGSVKLPRPQ